MSLKILLGLGNTPLSESEISSKISLAQKQGLEEINFELPDGSDIKVLLPLF